MVHWRRTVKVLNRFEPESRGDLDEGVAARGSSAVLDRRERLHADPGRHCQIALLNAPRLAPGGHLEPWRLRPRACNPQGISQSWRSKRLGYLQNSGISRRLHVCGFPMSWMSRKSGAKVTYLETEISGHRSGENRLERKSCRAKTNDNRALSL